MNKKEPQADGHIDVENHGAVLVARIDGGPHALFDAALTNTGTAPAVAFTTLPRSGLRRELIGSYRVCR
jgi:hypothetical protein